MSEAGLCALPFRISMHPEKVDVMQLVQSFSTETLKAMRQGALISEKVYREELDRRIRRNQIVAEQLNERLAKQKERKQ